MWRTLRARPTPSWTRGSIWVGRILTSANSAATKNPLRATRRSARNRPHQGPMWMGEAAGAVAASRSGLTDGPHSERPPWGACRDLTTRRREIAEGLGSRRRHFNTPLRAQARWARSTCLSGLREACRDGLPESLDQPAFLTVGERRRQPGSFLPLRIQATVEICEPFIPCRHVQPSLFVEY